MPRYALLFGYDGTGFHGFARQRNVRTVQGVLEERLSLVLREPVVTTGAGRTDAGVHARGQVATFDAQRSVDPSDLARRLNKMLAPEVSIRDVVIVPAEFDARFSAKAREYEYRIYGGVAPDPFLDGFALHVGSPLDVRAMDEAAQVLVGEHDFTSFCRANERSLVRRVRSIRVRDRRELVAVEVKGDSFCHQMVRSITGTLLKVGLGEWDAGNVRRALEARDRSAAAAVAPARGLTLMRVRYRPDPFAASKHDLDNRAISP